MRTDGVVSDTSSAPQNRCWGRNSNFARCGRYVPGRFCADHRRQPIRFTFWLIALAASLASIWTFLAPSELAQVRRQLDDANVSRAILENEYPLGHALLYVDGRRSIVEVEHVTAPGVEIDWGAVHLVSLDANMITVSWPHIKAIGRDGQQEILTSGTAAVGLHLDPPQTMAIMLPSYELWSRVVTTQPRIVFLIGLKPRLT